MKFAIAVQSVLGRLLLVVALGGLSVGTPSIGLAQAEETSRHTMMLRDVPLKTALERLAQTAQVNLLYDTELVTNTRVYCTAREATPADLLECLLRDLQLDYYQTSAGTYVLIEGPRKPPQRGHLAGVVVDATTGEPLPQANVLLAEANTGGATDQSGQFRFSDLLPGTHRVVTTYVGYKTTVDSIHVDANGQTQTRVELEPRTVETDPVVVDGIQQRLPSGGLGQGTLQSGELTPMGGIGTTDPLRQLGGLLGVGLQHPMADLHVQGSNPGEHRIELDGIPIRNPVTLRRLLGAFSPLALKRLTVHKAGFGAEHGSTLAGIIEVDHALADPPDEHVGVQVDPLSFNGQLHDTISLPGGPDVSVRVAGRTSLWGVYQDPTLHRLIQDWNSVDPFLLGSYFDVEGPLPFVPQSQTSDVGFNDLHAATRVEFSPFHSLYVSGYRGRSQLRSEFFALEEEQQSVSEAAMLTRDQYGWANDAGQARFDWLINARTTGHLQVRASRHTLRRGYQMTYVHPASEVSYPSGSELADTLRNALSPEEWPDDRNLIGETAAEVGLHYSLSPRHQLEGEMEAVRVKSRFDLGDRLLRPLSHRTTSWRGSAYVVDEISIGTHATVTLGSRFTYLPDQQTVYAEPRLSARLDATHPVVGDVGARVAGGLYRQFVNRFDVTSASPTAIVPSVRFWLPAAQHYSPPRAYHLTADAFLQPVSSWTFTVEGYYKRYPHLLSLRYGAFEPQSDESTPVPLTEAIGTSRGYALGVGVEAAYEGDRVDGTLRYSANRSRRTFPGRFDGRLEAVPWNQPHRLTLMTDVSITSAWTAHVQGTQIWNRPWGFRQAYYDFLDTGLGGGSTSQMNDSFGRPSTHRLPPLSRLDLGMSYAQEWKGIHAKLRVDLLNALNRSNSFDWGFVVTEDSRNRTERTLPGRRGTVTLNVRF